MKDGRDDTEVHSLGTILVRMRAITRTELAAAVEEQESMTKDQLLGELLINRGLIDRSQLSVALEAQENLRSKKPHVRALAAAQLAEISSGNVVHLATATRLASSQAKERRTGNNHPVVKVAAPGTAVKEE